MCYWSTELGRFIFILNCFVLVLIIFILSPSMELQQAVFSLGELIPLPTLSFPLCVGQEAPLLQEECIHVTTASFSCSYFLPSDSLGWAGLCCDPVLIFDWCCEFQVPHFHAAVGLKCRQVAPWKCKDSQDLCPHFLREPRATNVCPRCSSMYHLGFSTPLYIQPVPL